MTDTPQPKTTRQRLDVLGQGMSEATGAAVKFEVVQPHGKFRTFHEIRMVERRLRAALERIVNRPDEAESIAREALFRDPA